MKRTIEVNDVLEEKKEAAIADMKEQAIQYMLDNRADGPPDYGNDLDYDGSMHEIADGAVPIYTREIETAWFLYSRDLETAYENAGVGDNPRENDGMAAIYFYISQAMADAYEENKDEWYQEARQQAFKGIEFFEKDADDFMHADVGTWMRDAMYNEHGENADADDRREAAERLAGWYWWNCQPGCMPDGDAQGPHGSREDAENDAYENG